MNWLDIENQDLYLLIRALIALGLGFIIGLEREHSSKEHKEIFAGIRTFPIIALLGMLSAFLSDEVNSGILIITLSGVIILTALNYFIMAKKGAVGGTTEVAIILTFLIGALVFYDFLLISTMMAVFLTIILSLKLEMRQFVGKLSEEDIHAFLKFLILTAIILPVLPNEYVDPYEVINPRDIWFIVVLITGLSFVGYILMKLIGEKLGILMTGILGGLISSTAVTWDFSRKSKAHKNLIPIYATGIVAASSIMFFRMLVLLAIVETQLAIRLAIPLGLLGLAGLGFCTFMYYKKIDKLDSHENVEVKNPLNLWDALKFAIFFMIILVVVEFMNRNFGDSGVYIASFISGFTDVDAITLTMAKLNQSGSLPTSTVITAIILAATSNTLVKFLITVVGGNRALTKYTAIGFGCILIVGVLVAAGYLLVL